MVTGFSRAIVYGVALLIWYPIGGIPMATSGQSLKPESEHNAATAAPKQAPKEQPNFSELGPMASLYPLVPEPYTRKATADMRADSISFIAFSGRAFSNIFSIIGDGFDPVMTCDPVLIRRFLNSLKKAMWIGESVDGMDDSHLTLYFKSRHGTRREPYTVEVSAFSGESIGDDFHRALHVLARHLASVESHTLHRIRNRITRIEIYPGGRRIPPEIITDRKEINDVIKGCAHLDERAFAYQVPNKDLPVIFVTRNGAKHFVRFRVAEFEDDRLYNLAAAMPDPPLPRPLWRFLYVKRQATGTTVPRLR